MFERIKGMWCKVRHTVIYIIFGALTTIVNYLVYFPLYNSLRLPASISAGVAWAIAVLFAFFTNKPIVFESRDWSAGKVVPEFFKFVGMRIGSGVLEIALLSLTVDYLRWDGNLMKILLSVLVVVINYIASKFFVFKK